MTTKFVLAGVGLAIGIAFALDVEPAIAKIIQVQIIGTHSRAEISAKCKAVGGIESGTTPGTTGAYGCTAKGSVDCNDKGQCVGHISVKPSNPAANQPRPAPQSEIEAILRGS